MSADPYVYDIGELVFAREAIYNDGGLPGLDEEALLAAPGTRGMVAQTGVAEADERQVIYLVCFEDKDGKLGLPVGCLPEELTQDEALAKSLASTKA
jgi:nitrogen fixation protein NifZ